MVGEVDYLLSVQPIFDNHCVSCHSGTFGSGVLELDSFQRLIEGDSNNGPVVLPFNADSSLLYKVLLRDSVIVPNEPICCRMPKNADPLPIEQQATIYNWINEGALGPSLSINSKSIDERTNLNISPNPFNNVVQISFISRNDNIKELIIYDLLGTNIRNIDINSNHNGLFSTFWDGKNEKGNVMPAGIYFIHLNENNRTASIQKVLYLK